MARDIGAATLTGRRWGAYLVHERIGAGGMGEVYRARDTKLGRDVAVKVLPSSWATDLDRLARFEREARLLATLNHPNIATIHGLEEADGIRGLILELVEGVTLAERLARGPVPVAEALRIAFQIADALETAHERGILHRDLKPSNIKVTPAGAVKVLDFGLAKAVDRDLAAPANSVSPTQSVSATQEGVILGTPAYMSPEQARGRQVDSRADIWAFGCVLYELLTGKQAFGGDTVSDILAAVLEREPRWEALPSGTPPSVLNLLERCLEKDSRQRLRHIGDARIELDRLRTDKGPQGLAAPRQRLRREWVAWGLAFAATAVALLMGIRPPSPARNDPARALVRSLITLPPSIELEVQGGSQLAVSPDGTRLAFPVRSNGRVSLFVRRFDRFAGDLVPGTDGATHPFFSPDGRWIGFFANGALRKVPIDGGSPVVITSTPEGHGAAWALDDTIVFARFGSGLLRVPASGGPQQAITTLDADRQETGHDWPHVLPGGRAVLFTIQIGGTGDLGVGFAIAPLDGGPLRVVARTSQMPFSDAGTLLPDGDLVQARYAASGHLVYGQLGAVWSIPFDLERMEPHGTAIELADNVFEGPGSGAIFFELTSQGSLVYVPDGAQRALMLSDRRGRMSPLATMRGPFRLLRLSPDGQRVAVTLDGTPGPSSIWTFDLQSGAPTRVTSTGHNLLPSWRPRSNQIVHNSLRIGEGLAMFLRAAEAGGDEERLLTRAQPHEPSSWTPDGETLLFSERHPETRWDIWAFSLTSREATPVLVTPDDDRLPTVSPDGRWLAYVSDETGRYEVYVRPWRGPGTRFLVSLDGGTEPVWSGDGQELFFRRGRDYYTVPVRTGGRFEAGLPEFLFTAGLPFEGSDVFSYDVTPDGERFVVVEPDPETAPTHFRLVTNWIQQLDALVPAAR